MQKITKAVFPVAGLGARFYPQHTKINYYICYIQ